MIYLYVYTKGCKRILNNRLHGQQSWVGPSLLDCINSNISKKCVKNVMSNISNAAKKLSKKCLADQKEYQENIKKMSRRIKSIFKTFFGHFWDRKWVPARTARNRKNPPPHFR